MGLSREREKENLLIIFLYKYIWFNYYKICTCMLDMSTILTSSLTCPIMSALQLCQQETFLRSCFAHTNNHIPWGRTWAFVFPFSSGMACCFAWPSLAALAATQWVHLTSCGEDSQAPCHIAKAQPCLQDSSIFPSCF
jgi:hypothetical protein